MRNLRYFTFVLLIIVTFTALTFAQKKDYKPGEKIEWKSSDYPETWVEATFVRPSSDGRQPIIREMPNEFHKDGFEREHSGIKFARFRQKLLIKRLLIPIKITIQ